MARPCWRREDDYRYLDGADRAGIAWELLRRNPDYRAACLACAQPTLTRRGTIDLLEGGPSALRWGLHFRGRPRPPSG